MTQSKYLFGITGGSGTGKTTVSQMFSELGFGIIDCDELSRAVTKKGSLCLLELAANFGNEIISQSGELDRAALGNIVFSSSIALDALNDITHKYILEEIFKEADALDERIIGIDGAVLFESGITDQLECVVGVLSDCEKRIDRIMKRDKITRIDAEKRINSQKIEKFFIENCEYLIYNNDGSEKLREQVREVGLRLAEDAERKNTVH